MACGFAGVVASFRSKETRLGHFDGNGIWASRLVSLGAAGEELATLSEERDVFRDDFLPLG